MNRIIILLVLLINFSIFPSQKESQIFDLNEILVHHLMDHSTYPFNIGGIKVYEGEAYFESGHHEVFYDEIAKKKFHYIGGLDLHITKRVTMMWIASFLLLIIFIPSAQIIKKNPLKVSSRFSNLIESMVEFIRKDVVDENTHGHGSAYQHYILSLFFFILFCNLLGIIPPIGEVFSIITNHAGWGLTVGNIWNGITVTGDLSVTMTLAILTLILIYATGFIYQGPKFIIHSVPNGVPLPLYLIMWPLEFVISPLAKAFALTVRLLANMTAGHVIILALLGFIFEFQSYYIIPVSVLGAGMIYVLEIFVAFLQAYIFALLTSLFIGLSMHRH